eukprot:5068405-Amphidinium_carterae.1
MGAMMQSLHLRPSCSEKLCGIPCHRHQPDKELMAISVGLTTIRRSACCTKDTTALFAVFLHLPLQGLRQQPMRKDLAWSSP